MQNQLIDPKSVSRRTSSGLSRSEKWKRFQAALQKALLDQAKKKPEKFHPKLLKDIEAYSKKFSEHMIEKIESQSVIVMNETVAAALKNLDIEPNLKELYKLASISMPEIDSEELAEEKAEPAEEKAPVRRESYSFRGC